MTQEEKLGTAELSIRKANIVNAMNYSIERECTDLGDNLFGLLNGITHYQYPATFFKFISSAHLLEIRIDEAEVFKF